MPLPKYLNRVPRVGHDTPESNVACWTRLQMDLLLCKVIQQGSVVRCTNAMPNAAHLEGANTLPNIIRCSILTRVGRGPQTSFLCLMIELLVFGWRKSFLLPSESYSNNTVSLACREDVLVH